MDRIDLHIEVPALPENELTGQAQGELSTTIRTRVEAARTRQFGRQDKINAALSTKEIDRWCTPDTEGAALLKQAISRLNLSARAYHRILKIARTIADLADAENLATQHIAEAIQYRRFDRAV